MLQVSVSNSLLVHPEGENTVSLSGSYYEPGYNIMSPLELEFPKSDRVGLNFRKRADGSGTVFSNILKSTMTVTAIDPTNGEAVPYVIETLGSRYLRLYITNALDLVNPVVRVRVIDVTISDSTDDDFISFRILVDDDNKSFYYIPVETYDMNGRNSVSIPGRDVSIVVSAGSDQHILFSPYASLRETTSAKANFSYPLNTIFYKRQEGYNNEDYSYSVLEYSHSFLGDAISVMSVPSYKKVGVILVDARLYNDIVDRGVKPYVDISVNGNLSGISDTFRVNFTV